MTLDEQRQSIRLELEVMKAKGVHRRDLSLHACKRLFFDLGIRPSMAAVRDLTQTGSASDIPKDIDHFWERIRKTAAVKVGAGAIPPALEEQAGALLGSLFEHALVEAKEALRAERLEIRTELDAAERRLRDAEISRDTVNEALQRSEARAETAWARVHELETRLANTLTLHTSNEETLSLTTKRLTAETERLNGLLENERAANAALRERIDALHAQMQQKAEHYATQIKDAIAEAERRVKPMLVELDSLRSMASTYQAGIRDASRKEFDFIQQLSSAKNRADRLEAQVRGQSDEIDALTRELDTIRARTGIAPEIANVLCSLARAQRLRDAELTALGTLLDGHVALPANCPKCQDGEPELAHLDGGFELQCPECDHSSGLGRSRLEAVTRFLGAQDSASAV
ncbi:DNA-binding protein [Trinickia sp. LjRoot230]|uniref:DNA-binding protein n=1 Tax=Trinickia sp. LjRoot230 TaxID=3342288 RepID=UPI003ECF274B